MDGLSIRNSKSFVQSGPSSISNRSELSGTGAAGTSSAQGDVKSFADTLQDAVQKVNTLSKEADVQMQKLATGETKDIPSVMIATEKASVAFKLMTQVRNKIIDAYQEIMKMQV